MPKPKKPEVAVFEELGDLFEKIYETMGPIARAKHHINMSRLTARIVRDFTEVINAQEDHKNLQA